MAAISVIGTPAGGAPATVILPTGIVAGDYILIFGHKSSVTAPTLTSGYTQINTFSANANSAIAQFKVAAGTESGTSVIVTNSTDVTAAVYRGVGSIGTSQSSGLAATTSQTIPAMTLTNTGGKSWVVEMIASKQTTSKGTPTGTTLRKSQAGTTDMQILVDSNGGVSSWGSATSSNGTSATGGYIQVELILSETAPSITLVAPTNGGTSSSLTPQLTFTGTDAEADDITYETQVSSVSSFIGTVGKVQDASNFTTTSGSTLSTAAFAASATTGNAIIVEVSSSSPTVTGVTDSGGNSYSQLIALNYTGTAWLYVYATYGITGGPSFTVTAALTGTSGSVIIYAREVQGLLSTPFDTSTTGTGHSTALSAGPTSTTAQAVEYVIGVMTNNGGATSSSASGYTNVSSTGIPLVIAGMAELVTTTTGTQSITFATGAGSVFYGVALLAFKAASTIYLTDKVSVSDTGFTDITNGADTDPFASGNTIGYTVQAGDILTSGDTYYWRVRGKDPSGTNTFGSYSSTNSFTASTGGGGGGANTSAFFRLF